MRLSASILLFIMLSGSRLMAYTEISETDTQFSGSTQDIMVSSSGLRLTNMWSRKNPSFSPTPRKWHDMWTGPGGTYLFGGDDATLGERLNDIYRFDGAQWYELNPDSSPHAMADMRISGNLLFGGIDEETPQNIYSDLWEWDNSRHDWGFIAVSSSPPARYNHSWTVSGDYGVLFGGKKSGVLGDTWLYDISAQTWTQVACSTFPSAREGHGSSSVSPGKIMVYGGYGSSGYPSDTWVFSVSGSSWTSVNPPVSPPPRYKTSIYFDEDNGVAVLFGGLNGSSQYNDLWLYNYAQNRWYEQQPYSPSGKPQTRYSFGMAYDASGRNGVLFGGVHKDGSEVLLNDTWCYMLRSSGSYTSPVFDAGTVDTQLDYIDLSWDCSIPSDGDLKIQFASSDTLPADYFKGPDGSSDTFYTVSGTAIPGSHSDKRYFSYRVFLERSIPGGSTDFYVDSVSIKYNHRPTAPGPSGPPFSSTDNGGVTNNPVLFYWDNSYDGDSDTIVYEIEISTDTDFNYIIYSSSNIAQMETRTYVQRNLVHGNTYYWKVRGYDGTAWSGYSTPWSLFMDTVPPAGITALTALRGDQNGSVKLTWTRPDDCYAYVVRWDDTEIFNETRWELAAGERIFSPQQGILTGEEEEYAVTGLSDSTTYWFSLRLQDEAGNLSSVPVSPVCRTNSPPQLQITGDLVSEGWGTASVRSTSTLTVNYEISDPDPEDTHTCSIYLAAQQGDPFDITVTTYSVSSPFYWDSRNTLNGNTYVMKVEAFDQRGLSSYVTTGTLTIINYNEPPEVELKTVFPSGGSYWEGVHQVSWTYSDPNRADQLYCQLLVSIDGGSTFQYEDMDVRDSEIPYSWGSGNYEDSDAAVIKVLVYDNNGSSAAAVSPLFRIYNTNHPPGSFELIDPEDEEFLYISTAVFRWGQAIDPDGDPVTYELSVSTSPDYYPVQEYPGIGGLQYSLQLEDETRYYWRVTAVDSELVKREYPSWRTFAVDINPPKIDSVWPAAGSWLLMTGTESVKISMNKNPDPYIPLHEHISISDQYGNGVSYGYSLDTTTHLLVIVPENPPGIKPSRRYDVSISRGVKDTVGHPYGGTRDFSFTRLIEPVQQTVITLNSIADIEIVPNMLTAPGYVSVSEAEESRVTAADMETISNLAVGEESIKLVEIEAYSFDKKPVTDFNKKGVLTFHYTEQGGFVEEREIDERYLGIFRLDQDMAAGRSVSSSLNGSSWKSIAVAGLTDINQVRSEISRPGVYSLRAYIKPSRSFSGLIVYPNPFRPDSGDLNIKFILTEDKDLTLDIYTLTGDLVRSIEKSFRGDEWGAANSFSWNGRNGRGSAVASGMYYARIMEDGKEKENFLIGVIR